MQRKSGFLTFCFACLPGAGEMYLGYMKRGLSVMIAFWGLIFVASLLNMGILGILAPIGKCRVGPHRRHDQAVLDFHFPYLKRGK